MSYYLYILHSSKIDRYYIGISNEPKLRLQYHNLGQKGWTKRGIPWRISFTKEFSDRGKAQKWETWLKQQKNRSIIEKILTGKFNWKLE